MSKIKNKKFAAALISLLLMFTAVSGAMSFTSPAKAAAPEEGYTPVYAELKSDNFEGRVPGSGDLNDHIYHKTNMFFVEGNAANITTTDGEVISGGASLKWTPGHDNAEGWTESSKTLGLTDKKLTGLDGGYMIKLSLKVKFNKIDKLVIKNCFVVGGTVLQECVINGDYTNGSDASTQDKDPETSVEVVKKDGYAEITFSLRGDISRVMYYSFTAKTQAADSYIIFDDVIVHKEQKPNLKYRAYENFYVQNFEDGESGFNVQTGATATVVGDEVIAGEKSLKISVSERNVKKTVLKTDVITGLNGGYYKLYYRFKASLVSEIYVYVKNSADDEIIYDNCYNINGKNRIIEKTSPLFDSSAFDYNARGVYKSYGEFSVEEGVSAYVEICIKAERANGYLLLDDFNILREYTPQSILVTRPADNSAVKYTDTVNAKAGDVSVNSGTGAAAALNADGAVSIVIAVYVVLIAGLISLIVFRGKKKGHADKLLVSLICALVAFPAASLAGCGKKKSNVPVTPAGYKVIAPEKISGKLDNPGMGWVVLEEPTYGGHVDLGGSGTLPEVDNVSLDTSWAHIEVEEDVYDFNYLDQAIDYYTSIGKRVNFRICTDTLMLTYTYKGVPDYLFEKYNVAYEERDYSDPGPKRTFIVPDLTDKNYVERLGKFLEVLAARYADNDMIDTVEIRGYGVWGEWHSGYQYEDKEERMSALQNIIDKYYDVYAATGKVLAVPAAWDPVYTSTGEYELEGDAYMNYVNWSAFDYQWRLPNSTFRRDSGGGLMIYRYDEKILAEAFRSGKRVPLLGEYGTGYAQLSSMAQGFDLIDGINDILYKMRANYSTVLGWVGLEISNLIAAGETEFIDRGNEMFGYRLATDRAVYPEAVSAGGEVTLLTEWSNSAVGRFIYDSPLTFYFLDDSGNTVYKYTDKEFDARTFVQGETTDIYTSFTLPSSVAAGEYRLAAAITDENGDAYIELGQAGQIEDTRIYELGKIKVAANVKAAAPFKKTTFADINNYAFKNNTTYRVTFKYLPDFDMANFYFGENTGYEFSMTTAKGGANNTVGFYKWQDISGEAGWKTVTFTTGSYNDYKMSVISDKFGDITIGDVYIENVDWATTENFENYDFTDIKTILEPINSATARVYKGGDTNSYGNDVKAIGGESSIRLTMRSTRGYNSLAKVDTNNYKFAADTLYRVTFDFANMNEVAKGGYFFLGTGKYGEVGKDGNANTPVNVIAEWYDRDDTFNTKKTFTFLNDDADSTLVFGVKNGGTYLIDNLIISAVAVSSVIEGEDLVNERNVVPTYDFGIGITETFEGGSFARSGFDWAQFAWGRMTIDENEVVGYGDDNKCSLLGRVEIEVQNPATETIWFEFAKTKLKYYQFEPNGTYTVEFDYKILKPYPQGKIFCFFRSDENRNTSAQGLDVEINGKVGENLKFSHTFTLKNYNNYQFFFSMNYAWEVAVDNILITKV